MNETRFATPWCFAVKLVTVGVIVLLLGVSFLGLRSLSSAAPMPARLAMVVLPLAVLLGTLPFMVRGYVLSGGELRIERLGWQNRFALADVVSISADPQAIRRSIRLCGSGGMFGFFGWFRNKTLGIYRAYGTDPKNTVVIKFKNRTIVITPQDPERFVIEVNSLRGAFSA
jgi:hypothetical protein